MSVHLVKDDGNGAFRAVSWDEYCDAFAAGRPTFVAELTQRPAAVLPAMSCPDGGTCHHLCSQIGGGCFRVAFCGPLSGVYPDNQWPEEVRVQNGVQPDVAEPESSQVRPDEPAG